jgi:hypothetical protein
MSTPPENTARRNVHTGIRRPDTQRPVRMAVFGSCVTRDAFEFGEQSEGLTLSSYAARSTIRSLMAPEAAAVDGAKEMLLQDPAHYKSRMVLADLRKSVITDLAAQQSDYLILDLTSEIIPTLRWQGTLVTVSEYFTTLIPPALWQDLPREHAGTVQVMAETLQLIPAFIGQFSDIYGEDRIILHEAIAATHYLDAARQRLPFDEATQQKVARINRGIEAYYAEIRRLFPRIQTVRVSAAHTLGDVHHKWGLAFFHYVPEYYHEFLAQLHQIAH